MEIYKIMFLSASTSDIVWDRRTYFVYTVIAIHIDLDLLQLARRTCFNMMVKKMKPNVVYFYSASNKIKAISFLQKYQRSTIFTDFGNKAFLR